MFGGGGGGGKGSFIGQMSLGNTGFNKVHQVTLHSEPLTALGIFQEATGKVYPLGHIAVSWPFLYNLIGVLSAKCLGLSSQVTAPLPHLKKYGLSGASTAKNKFCLKEFLGWS